MQIIAIFTSLEYYVSNKLLTLKLMNSYNCYSYAVPSLVCDMAESTANGGIMIYWQFIHTGGLNITSVNITYTINNQATIQYGPDVDVDDTAAFIPSLIAGYSYVARE